MSFQAPPEKKEVKTFRKTEFVKLTDGTNILRILGQPYYFYQHWIKGTGIKCLDEDCPQCQLNQKIILDSGDYKEARNQEGYAPKQSRGAVNVLDRSEVKICPSCQAEVKSINDIFPATCPSCQQLITKIPVVKLEKVKVFSRAASVFDKLALIDQATLDENGEPIGIKNFDLELIVQDKNAIPRVLKPMVIDKVEVPEDALFDLENAVVSLTAEEMIKRMRGVSLKDIFAERRVTNALEDTEELTDEERSLAKEGVDELFS